MLIAKVKQDVNLEELCKNWNSNDPNRFELEGPFEEFCLIDRRTRFITQTGYSSMISEWESLGIIEYI